MTQKNTSKSSMRNNQDNETFIKEMANQANNEGDTMLSSQVPKNAKKSFDGATGVINVRMPKKLLDDLKKINLINDTTTKDVVESLLTAYVKKERKKALEILKKELED